MDIEEQPFIAEAEHKPTDKRPGLRIKQCRKYISRESIELFQHELQPWVGMSFEARQAYTKMRKLELEGLRPGNYRDYFSFVLEAEEFSQEMRLYLFDMTQVELSYAPLKDKFYFLLHVPGLFFLLPNVIFPFWAQF